MKKRYSDFFDKENKQTYKDYIISLASNGMFSKFKEIVLEIESRDIYLLTRLESNPFPPYYLMMMQNYIIDCLIEYDNS